MQRLRLCTCNFNDLKNENMKFETAKEYIKYIDEQSGQSWSDSTDEIADVMEDYAKMYHERQLKLLGIANVSDSNQWTCSKCGTVLNEEVTFE